MAVQSSGIITLSDIQDEFGGVNPISLSEYYRGGAYTTTNNTSVSTSGAISLSNFYGTTGLFSFTISSNTQEANLSTLATAAGWDGSAPLVATISSGVYVWSDDTAVPGLLINVANCTVTNNGYIIGKGGSGGSAGTAGGAGGPAINVSVSGVTLVNSSGAYIAGGGGGGAGAYEYPTDQYNIGSVNSPIYIYHRYATGGGGGGAGGGGGGYYSWSNYGADIFKFWSGGAGGAIGQAGSNGQSDPQHNNPGLGGGAGGGGGAFSTSSSTGSGAGGGGRILPGVGGTLYATGGSGSSAGTAGGSRGGGGGGWGAAGGSGFSEYSAAPAGGAGGAAISGTSPTLTNNGTIYGSTV